MKKSFFGYIFILLIIFFSLGVRLYAANKLNVDFDEPIYLKNGIAYANFIRTGQLKMLAWYDNTYEHPAFYKILYGAILLSQPPLNKLVNEDLPPLSTVQTTEARDWIMTGRYFSAFWGTGAVTTLTLMNPLAGFFLGINTLSVKYTSQVYLEAFPLLTSLLCALMYLRWFVNISKPSPGKYCFFWLLFSAIFLGLTAASKYVYCVVGIAIIFHFLTAMLRKQVPKQALMWLIGWGILSVFMFLAFNPYLWPHPISRLLKTIRFHNNFRDSSIVQRYNYPLWQSLYWLFAPSNFYNPRPKSAFLIDIDTLICIFAMIGLPRLFRQKPFFFYWLLIGILFLLAWTTKWPQYTLIILAPFSIAASEGVLTIWGLALIQWRKLKPENV